MRLWSCGEIADGASHTKRYFTSPALWPPVLSGETSTFCPWRARRSYRTTMPPRAPEPEAVDQITLVSTGSGVAQPLSPPSTPCHSLREICAPLRLLLGPRYDMPSSVLPYTK